MLFTGPIQCHTFVLMNVAYSVSRPCPFNALIWRLQIDARLKQ